MNFATDIRFSIIIPCYNYAEYLPAAINSVLEQQHAGTEILIIDDASTDNTPAIAATFRDQITYHRLEKNLGAAGAWCYGLNLAKGEYVCKLDADDMQLPGYLSTVEQAFMADPKIGLVATSVKIKDEKTGKIIDEILTANDLTLDTVELRSRLLQEFFFRVPGHCLRRSILLAHDIPRAELYQIHDWEYVLRVTKGHKARLIANPLAVYRLHNKSITSTARKDNILERDCWKWINRVYAQDNQDYDPDEKNILAGSLAVLVMRKTGIPYTPSLMYLFFRKYFEAVKIASKGGVTGLIRLHEFILKQGIKVISRVVAKTIRFLQRLIAWLKPRFRRSYDLFRDGGMFAGIRYIREEIGNVYITLTRNSKIAERDIKVECNVCGWKGRKFHTHCGAGYVVYNCICPVCGTFPRHRGFAQIAGGYLKGELVNLGKRDGLKLLFAPEYAIHNILSGFTEELVGVDYDRINALVRLRLDAQQTPFADNSVGFLSSFHVIEHLPDDRRALNELFRIMGADAVAVICVPINFELEKTIEFGKPNPLLENHYYDYGTDFGHRLIQAGFEGVAYRLSAINSAEEFTRLALQDELIFCVRKTQGSNKPVIHDHADNLLYGTR